jgi:hypothetical protein
VCFSGNVKDWDPPAVWQWLQKQDYKDDLTQSSWKYTNGATLVGLDIAGAQQLGVPGTLVPRLLNDIKQLHPRDTGIAG